jgi:hypothetical protein
MGVKMQPQHFGTFMHYVVIIIRTLFHEINLLNAIGRQFLKKV